MVGAVEDSTKEDILKLFNLNLVGAVQMMTAVMPKMREQNSEKSSMSQYRFLKWDFRFVDFIRRLNLLWIKVVETMRYRSLSMECRSLQFTFGRYQNQNRRK